MRSLAFVVVVPFVVACSSPMHPHGATGGSDSDGGGGDDDGSPPPDGGMSTVPPDASGLSPPARGFQLVSPMVDIQPGEQVSYCYYFHTPNTANLTIAKWESLTPGMHDMVLYVTNSQSQDPGTVSSDNCGGGIPLGNAVWTYGTQDPDQAYNSVVLPADDGAGHAIGQLIRPNQAGFILMHYNNTTGAVIHGHVELNAHAYPDTTPVVIAAPYVTYNADIALTPGSATQPTTKSYSATCTIPNSPDGTATGTPPKFFAMTTHTYRQGVHAVVMDGPTKVFESNNWEHPGALSMAPFYTFASGALTYQCDYRNPNTYSITSGVNPKTDEQCMAIGYFFPAATANGTGHHCIDGGFPTY